MSSTLKIEPANRERQSLSYELKKALRVKFEGVIYERHMDGTDISYLKGLRDAGIQDAQVVMDLIDKYDEVVLHEEF